MKPELKAIPRQSVVTSLKTSSVTASDSIRPNPSRLIDALRQIGYSLEQALSDLVDNAISANARTVLIRFFHDRQEIRGLAVADDGDGMSSKELDNAMRFGSDRRDSVHSLGKFGMGLKLASLSHAGTLSVATAKAGQVSARRWTLAGIRNDWACDRIPAREARNLFGSPWSPIVPENMGAVVFWEDIDKLPVSASGLRNTLRALHRRIDLHLGLHFHRFLESGQLKIFVDQQVTGESERGIRVEVKPLNPFDYPNSGAKNYPKTYNVVVPDVGHLKIQGHIWPPNSDLSQYRLGGRAAARQGFYFYRNERLIQAGGWCGLLQSETEPHSSLARVMVNLPPDMDNFFSLNVQKSSVIVPPGFGEAVRVASCGDGESFEIYRHMAEQVYRRSDDGAERLKPVHPGKGIGKRFSDQLLEMKELTRDDVRYVDFEWDGLNDDEIFRVDRNSGRILLNETYRRDLLAGLEPERNDLPFVKILLFHLLNSDLNKTRTSPKRIKELESLNRALIEAAKKGLG